MSNETRVPKIDHRSDTWKATCIFLETRLKNLHRQIENPKLEAKELRIIQGRIQEVRSTLNLREESANE